jgi:hypothetical protein
MDQLSTVISATALVVSLLAFRAGRSDRRDEVWIEAQRGLMSEPAQSARRALLARDRRFSTRTGSQEITEVGEDDAGRQDSRVQWFDAAADPDSPDNPEYNHVGRAVTEMLLVATLVRLGKIDAEPFFTAWGLWLVRHEQTLRAFVTHRRGVYGQAVQPGRSWPGDEPRTVWGADLTWAIDRSIRRARAGSAVPS